MNLVLVFLFILCLRLASVFIVQTYYVPDEYWQSLEVAHKLTFGYGYLTWEWIHGIRSYLYPLVIAGVYKMLALVGMDSAQLLIITPRILQAILTAYSDYRFFIWSKKRKWALFIITISYFPFYVGSRTLLNTLESSLITIALSFFPWQTEGTAYLWLVGIICYIRPTALIIWIPLCIYHLRKTRLSKFELILKRFLLIGLAVASMCVAVDSYVYGRLIVTPYEFLKFNVFQGIGSFYGTHPWYWYFIAGLPTVLGINALPFLFGIIETIRHGKVFPVRKHLLLTVLIGITSLSIVEHKEFRFLSSILPLCFYVCADAMSRWSLTASKLMLWVTGIVLVVGNVYPAYYLSRIHQSGPIELMPHLQKIAKDYRSENNHRASFLFLMPCHSTPFFSHIHENITMRFLTCEPNFKHQESYVDEAEQFYKSPAYWLRSHIPSYPRTAMPSHVILFEPLLPKITDFIKNYNVSQKIFMADYSEVRVGKHILVYDRLPLNEENRYNKNPKPDNSRDTQQFN